MDAASDPVACGLHATLGMSDLLALPTFVENDAFRVVVESPRGSVLKLKYDPEHRVITLSRPLITGLAYPYDWGFVPSTHAPDGDPLDAVVLWDGISYPGVVLPCRAIGVLRIEQTSRTSPKRERNDRLVAVPVKAPRLDAIQDVRDVSDRVRRELEQFFLAAVAFEGRDLSILGWGDAGEALKLVRASAKETHAMHR
jgi:inorganic pyrophosphatase